MDYPWISDGNGIPRVGRRAWTFKVFGYVDLFNRHTLYGSNDACTSSGINMTAVDAAHIVRIFHRHRLHKMVWE